jgi:hypothetical protein
MSACILLKYYGLKIYLLFYLSLYLCISDDIINRRQSIAHINFRKTVYRSLSLPYENDEFSNIFYIKYCLKVFLICLIILLISSLMKFLW